MIGRRSVASTVMAAILPAVLGAQSVRGAVTDRVTSTPVAGAVVQLIDSSGAVAAHALTNVRGEYRLSAAGAGTYLLRALRIGFRPTSSEVFVLAQGEDRRHDIDAVGVPLMLDTVRVVGRNTCRAHGADDHASAIWDQARTAFAAAQLTAKVAATAATIVSYERVLTASTRRVREQSAAVRSGFTTAPWKSLNADSLRRVGYVVEDQQGWISYYAPDLDVLLSQSFVEDHCFRLAASPDTTLIGLGFEPTRDRSRVAEISGTAWLHRSTSELRRLEFRYVNLLPVQEEAGAGGDMEFVRMADASWAIGSWSIRMPVLTLVVAGMSDRPGSSRQPVSRLTEIHVTGGELVLVARGQDTLWSRPPQVMFGTVSDSASGKAVSGSRLRLAGTDMHAVSDERGRYSIDGVIPGIYTVEIHTPSLDSMRAVHHSTVSFTGMSAPNDMRVPKADELAAALCANDRGYTRTSPPGIVFGVTAQVSDSVLLRDVRIVAEWEDLALRKEGASTIVDRRPRWLASRVNAAGAFRLCGVPVNTRITLRADGDSVGGPAVDIRIPPGGRFARAEVVLDRLHEPRSALAGIVLDDSTSRPLADVDISIPKLARSVLTDEEGRFRLPDLPSGAHRMVARRLGFGPLDTAIVLVPGRTLQQRILLNRVAVLDAVAVSASRLPRDFEDHRRLGLGQFLTRPDLASQEGRRLADILRELPGVRIVSAGGAGSAYSGLHVATGRLPQGEMDRRLSTRDAGFGVRTDCFSHVYLDNALVYSGADDEPKFDLNSISPDQIEGVEFYSSRLQLPMRYNLRSAICGVLVIHTRK